MDMGRLLRSKNPEGERKGFQLLERRAARIDLPYFPRHSLSLSHSVFFSSLEMCEFLFFLFCSLSYRLAPSSPLSFSSLGFSRFISCCAL